MPEINSIPYENAEDLKIFIFDNFLTTETIEFTTTNTGYLTANLCEMHMESGVTANSSCRTNYINPIFNPLYAEAIWKCYMNEMDNCFAFFGFKETTTTPTFAMIESHAGFMVNDGKLYSSVADGATQQIVEIVGIDMTRIQEYKINYNRFSIRPLPEVEETLGIPGVLTTFPPLIKKWSEITELSNYPPENMAHYLVQYITNLTNGVDRYINFNKFVYREVYAD